MDFLKRFRPSIRSCCIMHVRWQGVIVGVCAGVDCSFLCTVGVLGGVGVGGTAGSAHSSVSFDVASMSRCGVLLAWRS